MRYFNLNPLNMTLCLVLLFGIMIVFGGCSYSYPARAIKMIPESYEIDQKHNHSIQLLVKGGETEKTKERFIYISNKELKNTVEEAIKKSGLFTKSVVSKNAEYLLELEINKWLQLEGGLTVKDAIDISWTLIEQKTKKVVWEDSIYAEHTSEWNDAIDGRKRVRIALEGAVMKNIQEGLSEISHIKLKN